MSASKEDIQKGLDALGMSFRKAGMGEMFDGIMGKNPAEPLKTATPNESKADAAARLLKQITDDYFAKERTDRT